MTSSLFDLTGKLALVTGSSRGIGNAIARGLAEAGATVVLNGRDEGTLAAARAALGSNAEALAFDVTDEAAVTAAVGELTERHGGVDILVNNAAFQHRQPLLELPLAQWESVLRTDLTSAFVVGRAVAGGMIERGGGKIINICSVQSELARPSIAAYTAAKGGLRNLTRAMTAEWAPHGVRVNGLAPGYFDTELTSALVADTGFSAWVTGRTPAGRWGEVRDLVGPSVFLASAASDFVTGQVLYVDGGMTAVV
ncbi:gluconate 5-dehydrogenase [Prauserella marina]|uniref:Gluconate 5-dehydrogenase n=1 Tax=Prauserella marina TaxID=530584 RepID=A0A222VNJ2_9PSEU|nr:glucose 1-dehydrogenase [Prauserella marina]ASR35478.1 gluconate 5-dehydrogenase [Prauserella marina]PWV84703.1 gluconate 5-dehydrogenase [Prauserella marina]SDC15335.1 gluconate 5-dehydrogenase [Prauserella marina]